MRIREAIDLFGELETKVRFAENNRTDPIKYKVISGLCYDERRRCRRYEIPGNFYNPGPDQ